ncbi:hypothetical protein BX616_004335 [Lobosporangium transversale]|uniref:Hook-related protein family n=1 Tax=Lobosporangium transversale TaxID=64571 RepID=A0A1Y2GVS9_9FUNG|nr:hook-related protein family [Lobosporangium transversale]KAF9898212.1 hypothetical protein BX616_004335 [Lobosporangium transversale]ORZ26365.1 hook-related protein family [Lobosporangium transversale]|eukprot:XP_021884130.1 hook-related protein family [Lobosporangium transversale]
MDPMDIATLANAFEQWVNTFDNISRPCRHISDLSDGIILFEVAADIDPKWFKLIRSADMGDNWVHKYNNLKKLHKLVTRYLEEKLGQSLAKLDPPNLNAIAKSGDPVEVLKLCELVITVAVQCDRNQHYILKIQTLPHSTQRALMHSLEQIIEALNSGSTRDSDIEESSMDQELAQLHQEREELERGNQHLMSELQNMKHKYEELLTEREDLRQRIRDLEKASAQASQSGKSDFLMRTEIDHLRQDLQKSEERRLEQENVINNQLKAIADLSRAEAELSLKADEAVRLKDKLDEYKHAIDKLQKTENVIEKYKKKLEEGADLRRQMKVVEDQNQELLERNREIEEEYRKVLAFKSLMESYKEQILALESKNSTLAKEKNRLEYEAMQQDQRLQQLEADRLRDGEQMQLLEDKVRELEFSGGQGVPLSNDLQNMETDDMESSLLGQRTSQTTELKLEISRLERELQTLKEEKQDEGGSKVTVLQHLLDDANRIKSKYEQDYLKEHQDKIALQGELDRIRAGKGDESEVMIALRASFNACEKELADTKKALTEVEAHIKEQLELKNKYLEEKLEERDTKLERAKELITYQDNRIKELSKPTLNSDGYNEAVISLKSELAAKEEEVESLKRQMLEMQKQSRREQLLMTSAWHDQQKKSLRDNILTYHRKVAPTSWLGKQRNVFNSQLGTRH